MKQRITKRQAFKRFIEDKPFYLCPCKLYPDGPFSPACLMLRGDYMERAEMARNNPQLWKGTTEKTAWFLMYSNWEWFNATWETGYYAHYYLEGSA